jgi:hypothetical protein
MSFAFGLPAAIFGMAGLVAIKKKPVVSPETLANRRMIYEVALQSKDPVALRRLSQAFASQGHKAEAIMLEKRAVLRELPEKVLEDRREAMRKGLASSNASGVRNLAAAFEHMGCTGVAVRLREHAAALDAGQTGRGGDGANGEAA